MDHTSQPHRSPVLACLLARLGDTVVFDGTDSIVSGKLVDWGCDASHAQVPAAFVLPRTTEEVAAAVRICAENGVAMVPQGGLTGLLGGANALRDAVVINLERMRRIEEIDPDSLTMTVEAGTTLKAVQDAATEVGLFYPLDIGGRGSCTIGGNIATNAGGNRVLRYGMTRDLVLGLEVVLADGTIVTSMTKMLKNNTGYDWKQQFVGSEGTLGIVTRAVLKLFPAPRSVETCLCAVTEFDDTLKLLARARSVLSANLSAFEVMWPQFYSDAIKPFAAPPLPAGYGGYVLIESSGGDPVADNAHFAAFLEACLQDGIIVDAMMPQSQAEVGRIWEVRDRSGEMVRDLRPLCNYDVSIETSRIGTFTKALEEQLRRHWPSVEMLCFGHLADSNVHIFVRVSDRPFPQEDIDEVFYAFVRDWNGSISAEIGIGLKKRKFLSYSRSKEELALMRLMKQALDPEDRMNPTKVFLANIYKPA